MRATSACIPTIRRCCRPGDRKVLVENVTDAARLGYAALRVLRQRAETICFVTGHGETFRPMPGHYHFSHVETLRGHDMPGADDVLVAEPEQLDRLQLALNEIGFEMRPLVMATASAIPADCTVVAEIGPRAALAAGEADLLADYLKSGGRLAMLIDPQFPLGADLQSHLLDPAGPVERTGHHHRSSKSFSHRSGQGRGALLSPASDHGASRADGVCAGAADPPRPATGGVRASVLAASSQDSYLRPPSAAGGITVAAGGPRPRGRAWRPGARGGARRRLSRSLARQALSARDIGHQQICD